MYLIRPNLSANYFDIDRKRNKGTNKKQGFFKAIKFINEYKENAPEMLFIYIRAGFKDKLHIQLVSQTLQKSYAFCKHRSECKIILLVSRMRSFKADVKFIFKNLCHIHFSSTSRFHAVDDCIFNTH